MFCSECSVEIPPQWSKVIESNICPNCGGSIANDEMKELLEELKTALEKMPNDANGIASWLLSNYQMQKIGSAQPVLRFYRPPQFPGESFHPKAPIGQNYGNDEDLGPVKIKTNPYFERAGLPQPEAYEKNPVKKGLINKDKIRAAASKLLDDQYGDGEEIIDEEVEEEDYEYQPPKRRKSSNQPQMKVMSKNEMPDVSEEAIAEMAAALSPPPIPTDPKEIQSIYKMRMDKLKAQAAIAASRESLE